MFIMHMSNKGNMDKVKRCILVSAACFIVATGYAQDTTARADGETLNLRQCVDIAIKNNILLKTTALAEKTDWVQYQQSIGNILPNASAQVYHQDYNGRSINPYTNQPATQQQLTGSYQVNANIVLWNGSSLQRYLRANREAYIAGGFDVQQSKDNLTITIILDYLSVLSAKEQLSAAITQDSATREQVRVNQAKFEQGAMLPGDYYNLRGTLSQNEVTVATAVNTLETAKVTLSKDMNVQYSSSINLTPFTDTANLPPYGSSVEEMYAYSLTHLPMIESANLKERSALNVIKAARGTLYPTLYLTGGTGTSYSNLAQGETQGSTTQEQTSQYVTVGGTQYNVFTPVTNYSAYTYKYGYQLTNNINYYVGIQLQIPILNGFSARSRLRNARINEEQVRFNQSTAHIQLRQAIVTDYINMTSAYRTYRALQQQVEDFGQAYTVAKARYDAGVITSYDFVLAKNSFDGATLNLIGAKYNYILQTKILDYYLGKLTL